MHSHHYANTHIHNVTVTNCNTLHGEEERSGRTGIIMVNYEQGGRKRFELTGLD